MYKYKLIIFLLASINIFKFSISQTNLHPIVKKELTLEYATLQVFYDNYYKNTTSIDWILNTENFYIKNKNKIEIRDSKNNQISDIQLDSVKCNSIFGSNEIPNIDYFSDKYVVMTIDSKLKYLNYNNNFNEIKSIDYNSDNEVIEYDYSNEQIAFVKDNNIYYSNSSGITNKQITFINDKNIVSGLSIHRQEFGINKGLFFSPNGRYLAFYQKNETEIEEYPLLTITSDFVNTKMEKYPMAGRNSEIAKIGIIDLNTFEIKYLNIINEKYDFLTNLTWSPDSKKIYLFELNRAQNHLKLNEYDVNSLNILQTLYEEKNDKWVEPENSAFFSDYHPNNLFFISEKDGFDNLYMIQLQTKKLTQITFLKSPITNLIGIDKQYIYTETPGEKATEIQIFKTEFKSKKSTKISKFAGTYSAKMNQINSKFISVHNNINNPNTYYLGDNKSLENIKLHNNIDVLKNYKLAKTEIIELKSNHGEKLYSRIIKPFNFDPTKKYPVLIYVYGGPHAQMVTDQYMGYSLWKDYLANQGYIVFMLDNRGSKNRGFDFENQIHRQLGAVEAEDQYKGIEYLKSLNYIDTNRIAIHGWSFGGFMTMNMLTKYPNTFTCGVAGGPVTDWKYYEVMYGERYMDMPIENAEGYKNSSIINNIYSLKSKLLSIHGTIDEVVLPIHNLALNKKCIESKIHIDYYEYPNHRHNVRGKDRIHLMRKIIDYVIENNK